MSLGLTTLVQYWRSFDHLEAYARARDKQHWPAWIEFNRRMKNSHGDVGIWHETYIVRAGEYETVYSGMPLIGLAKAGRRAAVTAETESARERLGVKQAVTTQENMRAGGYPKIPVASSRWSCCFVGPRLWNSRSKVLRYRP